MVSVDDCHAGTSSGTPGSNPPPHIGIFFSLKFKRLALWQHLLSRNEVSVSRNLEISCECTWIGRGRFEIWKQSLHEASLAWLVIREFCLCLKKKYLDLSSDYKFTYFFFLITLLVIRPTYATYNTNTYTTYITYNTIRLLTIQFAYLQYNSLTYSTNNTNIYTTYKKNKNN